MGGWGSSTSSSTTHGMLVGSLLPSFLLSCFPCPLVRPLDDPDLYTAIGNLSLHLYPCSFCRRLVGLRHRADRTQQVFVGAGGLRRRRARAAPSSALMCVHACVPPAEPSGWRHPLRVWGQTQRWSIIWVGLGSGPALVFVVRVHFLRPDARPSVCRLRARVCARGCLLPPEVRFFAFPAGSFAQYA